MSAAIVNNVVSISPTRADYARRIRARLTEAVEAVLDVGRMLIEAKKTLPHGELQAMTREDLGWSPRTAQRFMAIARHPELSKATHASRLPASWSLLAELARLEPKRLEAAIADGSVRPDMKRTEATRLVNEQMFREQQCTERVARVESRPRPKPAPPPGMVLRGIATETEVLIGYVDLLEMRVRKAIDSGTFGVPRRKGQRKRGWCEADALNGLSLVLRDATEALGAVYDNIAELVSLPTREQA